MSDPILQYLRRATQLSDAQRIEAFLVETLAAESELDAVRAGAIAARIARRIKRVVVWDDASEGAPIAATASVANTSPEPTMVPATAAAVSPVAAAVAPFDPYAFSAVVVLTRSGRDGLMQRLAEITNREHLVALADAQHLAVDRVLPSAEELRAAIVAAAEQRIANRRAAAS